MDKQTTIILLYYKKNFLHWCFYQVSTMRRDKKKDVFEFLMNGFNIFFKNKVSGISNEIIKFCLLIYVIIFFIFLTIKKGSFIVCNKCFPFDNFMLSSTEQISYMNITIIALYRYNETNVFFTNLKLTGILLY